MITQVHTHQKQSRHCKAHGRSVVNRQSVKESVRSTTFTQDDTDTHTHTSKSTTQLDLRVNKDGVVVSQGSDLTGVQHYGTDTARDGNILYVYYAGAK